ncbi:MAG: hypothetical protein A3A96_02175 [Candidatus Zambryskibacteria bacterium RIFCSPLOWO2_01_FULL_39_39]|uniref:DNA 3'-5' helicase n=1 Tax=Candidatus Zambryskibacteria bacterium RIFCSPLOWO2_01_FULL_39_39 TaxID=1802758 RepID=A0A1G2U095_9BACT|nr:MAG: hypothetical protein A2644_02960 [Candidatus Zambryskibacteria bacterium RIFCSPHIGHO2_01_FULL_39_63]OHA95190.1 MAG: hypothetical protein A3B88_03490 [Candidatus Zambryskibacteria bacterium RIFCSPHIGHO2_02_FULL_39_19]OHA98722.1 MAG: hypothetical protein A3F20_01580 [Candidatus Zambryskibacteria bacterium RIFCSPHIGHO2_12_FULL_39_21]OHB02242.1 MAG: hypothetical protein A3A96_02175 [Candidatus Zambryskibacteria bacterium RIFCSPLOWO2_01_FULL_39_39]
MISKEINQEFTRQYSRLNRKQKEAVDTIEGPVMVIAGPGTGKTTILTLRIANILKETDTPVSGILALTFTEVGVKNIKIKLREIIGSRADEVRIHTFHSFAVSVIREFEDHFPNLSKSRQITEIEAESMVREILKQKEFNKLRPLGEPDFYVYKILQTIAEAKKEAWTPEILESFAKEEIERIKNDENSVSTRGISKGSLKAEALKRIEKCEKTVIFAKVYRKYEEKKKEDKKIDFDDLLFELVFALKRNKLLLQLLQEKFLYILVDEHQDTNDAQNLIIKTIADFFESPNLFVVGDEKQAIYRFQGASVQNFLFFEKLWQSMKVINLESNYRSHQAILDASFKMIEENYKEGEHLNLRIKLEAGKNKDQKPVEIIDSPDTKTEMNFLVERIKEIQKEDKESTLAIIVRKNKEITELLSILEKNNIKASAERGVDIFSHPIGILFFELAEFLSDPSKIESLIKTIGLGLWNLDFKKQIEFIKLLKAGKTEEIEKEIPQIKILKEKINEVGTLEYITLISDLSGLTDIMIKNGEATEVWRGIFSLAKEVTISAEIYAPSKLLVSLLEYKKSAEKRSIKIHTSRSDEKINIMTAHSSKGLEFDYVFIPFATEESWIRKVRGEFFILPKEKEGDDDIRDERRLFYVALTRAKRHITISLSKEGAEGEVVTPLRFLDELDKKHILHKEIKRIEDKQNVQTLESIRSKDLEKLLEYSKNVLLENGLSVTALNHFIKCQSEFFYKSIMKIPEAPNASSEKGNAMHNAIARVWQNKNKSIKEKETTLKTVIKEYFNDSLLPKFEKEAIQKELLENAPIVVSELENHFGTQGEIYIEKWFETIFEHEKNKGEKINIKLHGKLDALIEQENKLFVFDYKTTTGKSINEIKGDTKNSDGNYFRQLIFYKILLEENNKFKNKEIELALAFIKPDSKSRCPIISLEVSKSDVERVKREINSLLESVWSGSLLNQTCPDKNCEYCRFKSLK